MKRNPYFITVMMLAACFFACQPEPQKKTADEDTAAVPTSAPQEAEATIFQVPVPGALSPADSAKVAEIDEYSQSVIMLQSKTDQGFTKKNSNPKNGHEKDVVQTTHYQGNIIRSVTSYYSESSETRDYYLFRENKPVQFKHRKWHFAGDAPWSREIIAYMEGDQVISLQERRADLEAGQNPGAMLRLPLLDSTMDRDSFLVALNQQWKTVKESVDLD